MNVISGYNDNQVVPANRNICRFYVRGMCRFGNRCWNVHDNEIKKTPERQQQALSPQKTNSPQKPRGSRTPASNEKTSPCSSSSQSSSISSGVSKNLTSQFGPSTSSSTEAINLVRRAQSEDKSCGICFDAIYEKEKREQVFGILPNCNHCFCFSCIRKWRQSKEFDLEVAKACPECRTASEYVYPSKFWLEAKEEKQTFISNEKSRMQKVDCKYFRKGSGRCPFGNTCLYLHALPNGKKMDVGPPKPRRPRGANVDQELVHQILFWLNDDDLDIEEEDDEDDVDLEDPDFELDLDDPCIAMQYYDHDDIRRYMAIERLMNPGGSDNESDDLEFLF